MHDPVSSPEQVAYVFSSRLNSFNSTSVWHE